jgi:uncharacterized secreted protein with C-terminal beta-propeller domain/outer membrane protein assembly factor BamB
VLLSVVPTGGGSISGTVFDDLDRDGVRDVGEPGLAGWTVELEPLDTHVRSLRRFGEGCMVAIQGDKYLVGGPPYGGPVKPVDLYDLSTGQLLQVFDNPDPQDYMAFGRALAFVGDQVAVPASTRDIDREGCVFIFDRASGELSQTIVDPSGPGRYFGQAIAGVDGRILIGRSGSRAALFDAETGDLLQTFQAPQGTSGFGKSVAFLGEDVLIASRQAAFLFDASTGEQLQQFDNPGATRRFGCSIAASGDMVLVGAASYYSQATESAAYLYDATSGELRHTFVDPVQRPNFGRSVAFAGDRVLVGAAGGGTAPDVTGAVYLFDSATGELLETFRCPTSHSHDQDEFGGLVAGGDGWVLVGTALQNSGVSASAHLFTLSGSAGDPSQTTTDAEGNYDFGGLEPGSYQIRRVSPDGYRQTVPHGDGTFRVAVGPGQELTGLDFGDFRPVPPAPPDPGSIGGTVFQDLDEDGVFDAGEPGLEGWTVELARLGGHLHTSEIRVAVDEGNPVAVYGDKYVVGAPSMIPQRGVVHLFDLDSGALLRTFSDPDPENSPTFGNAVALTDDFVLVGAKGSYEPHSLGWAYLFDAASGELLLSLEDPVFPADNRSDFGRAVVADEGRLFVSDPTDGAVYVFDDATGELLQTLSKPPGGIHRFGKSLALAGAQLLVGSYEAVYVFDVDSGELLRELARPADVRAFASSMAVSDAWVLVGSMESPNRLYQPYDGREGAAYLFDLTTGELLQTFSNPYPGLGLRFGAGVAIVGDRVFVGAPGRPRGAVCIFDAATGELVESLVCPESHLPANDTHLPDHYEELGAQREFGGSLAVSGEYLVVGARIQYDHHCSRVHVFDLSGSIVTPVTTTETDAEGNFQFPALEPGSYVVTSIAKDGFTLTLPADGAYTAALGEGEELSAFDFGYAGPPPPPEPGSLSGTVFEDLDGDGTRDANESGLSYVAVWLLDSESNYVDQTHTDADGHYAFADVSPGSYVVDARVPYYASTLAQGGSQHEVAVAEGEELSNVNFGFIDQLDVLTRFESPEQIEQFLIEAALAMYAGMFGRPEPAPRVHLPYYKYPPVILTDPREVIATVAGYSDTNLQVVGVDEGDLVETDGDYLYILSGQELVIVDARDPQALQVASRLELEDRPFAMYLAGDRLTLLGRKDDLFTRPALDLRTNFGQTRVICRDSEVTLTVLDVSDRQSPATVRQTSVDGRYVDSRAIGDVVYLVVQQGLTLPAPMLIDVESGMVGPQQSLDGSRRYETKEEYLARIEGQIIDLAMPHFRSYGPDGQLIESALLSKATDVYWPAGGEAEAFVSVVAFNVAGDAPGPISSVAVPGHTSPQVYVSQESLYLLQTRSAWRRDQETSIVKIDFDEATGGVELSASGKAPGRVLNQFSVDEHDGYLRIATTQGRAGWRDGPGNSGNNLYVLQQQGGELQIVGSLEDLAPGEKIYSARFLGDRAFVVTYKKVDPLFAVDLSDPTDPRVAGELKIPGFSNYLHSIDGGFLIGVGRHADEQTGLYQDPQVSLFNVDDLSDPQLLDRFTLDTGRSGGLGIFSDHHVIAYYPEHSVLTVSVPDGEGWSGGPNDLWVFQIDVQAGSQGEPASGGIERLTRIEHDSSVVRSVRIGDLLYAISSDTITVHEILDPASPLAELFFGAERNDPPDTSSPPDIVPDQVLAIPPNSEPTEPDEQSDPDPLLLRRQSATWQPSEAAVLWQAPGRATSDVAAASRVRRVLVYQDDDVLDGRSPTAPLPIVPVDAYFSGGRVLGPSPDRALAHDALFSALESDAMELGGRQGIATRMPPPFAPAPLSATLAACHPKQPH